MPPSYSIHSCPNGECVVIVMPLSILGLDAMVSELRSWWMACLFLGVPLVPSSPSSFASPMPLGPICAMLLLFPVLLHLLVVLATRIEFQIVR